MTNTALQAMIEEYGDRICMIIFDNNSKIHIGYPSSPLKNVASIKLATKGGVDMIGTPRIPNNPADVAKNISAVFWRPTSCIQGVIVMDAGCMDYRIDPWDIG